MASVKDKKNSNETNERNLKKKKENETQQEVIVEVIKDPALGQTIDISG